jgi:hypothetical protein
MRGWWIPESKRFGFQGNRTHVLYTPTWSHSNYKFKSFLYLNETVELSLRCNISFLYILYIYLYILYIFYVLVLMLCLTATRDRLCGPVVRVLGYRSGGPGSIPETTRKKSCGSGTGSTQPREYKWGATWYKISGSCLENREYGRRDP